MNLKTISVDVACLMTQVAQLSSSNEVRLYLYFHVISSYFAIDCVQFPLFRKRKFVLCCLPGVIS